MPERLTGTALREAMGEARRKAWTPGMLARNGCRYLGDDKRSGEMIWADPVAEGAEARYVWPFDVVGPGWRPDDRDAVTAAFVAQEASSCQSD
jgi:hypothetical protein